MSSSRDWVLRIGSLINNMLCRIDDQALHAIPQVGPLILITNHTHLVEIPIIYDRLQPRRVHGFVASFRWENPILAWLLDTCETIPLQRGQADISAIRRGLELLKQNRILIIMPEGTRNYNGILQEAHPGIITLAMHSGAPIQAFATTGAENFSDHIKNLRRCPFHFAIGSSFKLNPHGEIVTGEVRKAMLMEVMAQIAALLPEGKQGIYSPYVKSRLRYLDFLP